ncbi:MAG: glutamyl-tRNA reductase, partial [Dehalococcoidia bacterium]
SRSRGVVEGVSGSRGPDWGPHILALGLNYKQAPIGLRERLAFAPRDLDDSLAELKRRVPEGAILSTCHRVEFYAATSDPAAAASEIKAFWSAAKRVRPEEFSPYLYRLVDREAVRHLLTVSSGLDSAIVGESQVLGQVRYALRRGLAAKSLGRVLSKLFRQALTTGKRARTETGIGRNAASLGSAAVEMASRHFGDLSTAQVMLVGAGKMGELAAKSLVDRGASGIAVVGRTVERARRLALSCGNVATLTQLEDGLRSCDIVLTGTSAPHPIMLKQMVERAMEVRRGRELLIVDIAVPRDVEPDVADVPGVTLLNIDDLEETVEANVRERLAQAGDVESIIDEGLEQFTGWMNVLRVVPTITALVRHADEIRDSELARTAEVLGNLPEPDRQRIEALTLAIQKKLLHRSIMMLRAAALGGDGIEMSRVVADLFELDPPDGGTRLEGAS